jgi:hypothetical protein
LEMNLLCGTLSNVLRSPLLWNLFECFYHCFVLVGEQVILFVIHMTYLI